MQLVLLGLSQPRMRHLGIVLEQALAPALKIFSILTPTQPEGWTPPCLPFRILLFVTQSVDNRAALWRDSLLLRGLPFQVIQASDEAWVEQCIQALLPTPTVEGPRGQVVPTRWQGVCETCSDPDCERRLFSGLLQS